MSFAFFLKEPVKAINKEELSQSANIERWLAWANSQHELWDESSYGISLDIYGSRNNNPNVRKSQRWMGRPIDVSLGPSDEQIKSEKFTQIGKEVEKLKYIDPELIRYGPGSHFTDHKDRVRNFDYNNYNQIGTLLLIGYASNTVGGNLVVVDEDLTNEYEYNYWERKQELDMEKWFNKQPELETSKWGFTDDMDFEEEDKIWNKWQKVREALEEQYKAENPIPKKQPNSRTETILVESSNNNQWHWFFAFIALGQTHHVTEIKSGQRIVFKQTVLYPRKSNLGEIPVSFSESKSESNSNGDSHLTNPSQEFLPMNITSYNKSKSKGKKRTKKGKKKSKSKGSKNNNKNKNIGGQVNCYSTKPENINVLVAQINDPNFKVPETKEKSSKVPKLSDWEWLAKHWDNQLQKSFKPLTGDEKKERDHMPHYKKYYYQDSYRMDKLVEYNERIKWIQSLYVRLHGNPPDNPLISTNVASLESYMKNFREFEKFYNFQVIEKGDIVCD